MVAFLHDAIPITHPELVTPRGRKLFGGFLANACRYASAFITTTETARQDVEQALAGFGRVNPKIWAVPLGVADEFTLEGQPDPELQAAPYFIACSPLEVRKNQMVLLDVWKRMIADGRGDVPTLVLVGKKVGNYGQEIIQRLEGDETMRGRVIQVDRLSNAGLVSLMRNARALLAPSAYEGFGLPLAEALSVGTPVIASDIPSHREVGGKFATYVDPGDCAAWMSAISQHERDWRTRRAALLANYKPRRWRQYFTDLQPFLDDLART